MCVCQQVGRCMHTHTHAKTHTHAHQVKRLEMELQWVMVMELERAILPLDDQLQKERSRIPRNQQNITKAEVQHIYTFSVCTNALCTCVYLPVFYWIGVPGK